MKVPRDNRWKTTLQSPKLPLTSKSPSIEPSKSSLSIKTKEYIQIDDYEYAQCDLLGTGYTSKVYLGRVIDNKRKQVAIKAIDLRKISKQKEHLQLLKQEMHIHQQLDHPNIVKCHKIVEKGHYYYFFLEYCAEGTLDSFIKRHQKLAESTTVTIIEQIIAGYKYLLEHKVLHRDLKPPNILKSGYNWKICDFGFSVMGKKHLVGNINVGTPSYMAPQALERTYYSPKTDIFSIGVICYEMLFGKAPWHHKDQAILLTMMQKRISEQTLNSIANRNLAEFIGKCCQPHQRRRMGLEQFQQFNFWKQYEPKTTSIKLLEADDENSKTTSKTLSTMRDYSLPTSSCPSQTTNLSTAKHIKKQATEPAFSINKAIIEQQLYICNIILALMKNYSILPLIDDIQKDLYLTVLARHSNYMLRRIVHNKFNYLSLKKWEDYSSNQQYLSLVAQASELTEKINAVMKAQTRRKSIITIRIFNKRYDDLTYDKNLSQKCIEHMKDYIHQIMTNLLKKYESEQNKQVYQTLLYLNKYYKYISNMPTDDEKSRVVHMNQQETSRESIIMEFRDAVMSERQFSKLKQEISNIHS